MIHDRKDQSLFNLIQDNNQLISTNDVKKINIKHSKLDFFILKTLQQ